jgi:hypothetical protein
VATRAETDTVSEQLGEARLSAEDADRLAADIRPAWDLDEGSLEEGAMGAAEEELLAGASAAPSSGEPTDPTPPPAHDTLIQGTPTLAVGDGAAASRGDGPISTSRTQQVPEPARKKTIVGLGDDGEESVPIPLDRKLAPPAGAPEKGPGDTLESPKLDLPRSSKPSPSSQPVLVSSASARASEESISLPLTKTSGSALWIGLGLAAVAAAAIGFFALSGDETSTPSAATPTATVAPAATTATPPAPSAPATQAAATAPPPASAALPTPTAAPVAAATVKPGATPAKPATTSKPGGGTPPAKPTSTSKPGLMRDAPF